MNYDKKTRISAGRSCSIPQRQHHRKNSSALQQWVAHGRPHLSSYGTKSGQTQARSRRSSEQLQASSRAASEQSTRQQEVEPSHDEASVTAQGQQMAKKNKEDNDEWDMLEHDDEGSLGTMSSPAPSYEFPGTWPAALHDATSAISHIGTATASYATALSRSGMGKAGWSVGAALTATANRRALSLVDWAVERTGTGTDQLPRPISGWLKGGKEKLDEQGRSVRRRKIRKARRDVVERGSSWDGCEADRSSQDPMTFGDDRGAFVLETAEMDSTGNLLSEMSPVCERPFKSGDDDGWADASTMGVWSGERDMREQDEDYEGHIEEQREDDGMMRLFEFDD